jgi:aldose 1-epimerase
MSARDDGRLTLGEPGGELELTLLTSLGMVASSLLHRGEELLALRGGAAAYASAREGSTFGIPLLAPWANRLSAWEYSAGGRTVELDHTSTVVHIDRSSGLPMHGLLGASRYWTVTDHDSASVVAELDLGAHAELLAAFPFPHRLAYRARVGGGSVEVAVTLTPTSDLAVPVAFGFHPYLTLPGSPRESWTLELDVKRRAVLSDLGLPTGEHVDVVPGELDGPLADRVFDDSYDRLSGATPRFALADGRRRVELTFLEGYEVAQIYSPIGASFVCFEPMTAPVDALRSGQGLRFVEPGSAFTARFSVSVSASRG